MIRSTGRGGRHESRPRPIARTMLDILPHMYMPRLLKVRTLRILDYLIEKYHFDSLPRSTSGCWNLYLAVFDSKLQ